MKTRMLYILFLIAYVSLPLAAQQKSIPKVDDKGIFLAPDQLPVFPGGNDVMFKFLSANVKYPAEAREKGIGGRVIVQFVVREDGSVTDGQIIRGIDPLLDEAALKVLPLMPKWAPGMDAGKAVPVRMTLPILFNIPKDKPSLLINNEILFPIGQTVTNHTLQGVWQTCTVRTDNAGYHVMVSPILKILSKDKTFMNIFSGDGKVNAVILVEGEYKQTSDNTYVEKINKAVGTGLVDGVKNEITFKFLHNNLMKISFTLSGKQYEEYWCRVLLPMQPPLLAN